MHSTVLVHNKQVFFSRISFTGRSLCILIGIAISPTIIHTFVIPFCFCLRHKQVMKKLAALPPLFFLFIENLIPRPIQFLLVKGIPVNEGCLPKGILNKVQMYRKPKFSLNPPKLQEILPPTKSGFLVPVPSCSWKKQMFYHY